MRRCASILIVFLVGLAAGRLWQGLSVNADGPPVATENGDTNGDGLRDISDAVYQLQWLFLGGPEPVPISGQSRRRFVDNGDGTVTDNDSGLMWLQASADVNGDGAATSEDVVTNQEAYELAPHFSFAGHSDWRMPNQALFSSLVVSRDDTTNLDPVFEIEPGAYWAGSSNAGDPCHGEPFVLWLPGGSVELNGTYDSGSKAHVLLVRTP